MPVDPKMLGRVTESVVKMLHNVGFHGTECAQALGYHINEDDELPALLQHLRRFYSFDVHERVQLLLSIIVALGQIYTDNLSYKLHEPNDALEGDSLHGLLTSGDIGNIAIVVAHIENKLGGSIT